uniref:Cellulase n=1 Tax=Minutocellus polymorphus TaxID=265543 RepID=A0A7S0FPF9_9STRA
MTLKRALFATPILFLELSIAPPVQSFSTQQEVRKTFGQAAGALHAASDYLSSLSSAPEASDGQHQQSAIVDHDVDDCIPDEHYSKDYPNAGWRGYANPQWGGYLDALPSNRLEEGKKSDYGDDIRWGAEVYLSSVENEKKVDR